MKSILVLARNDNNEAMRVAAGLTIFGHDVELIMLGDTSDITPDNEQLDILELADIEPMTTRDAASEQFTLITSQNLNAHLRQADVVLNF